VKSTSLPMVLSIAIFSFGVITVLLVIVDLATGGRIKDTDSLLPKYGNYNPNILFPIFILSGMFGE